MPLVLESFLADLNRIPSKSCEGKLKSANGCNPMLDVPARLPVGLRIGQGCSVAAEGIGDEYFERIEVN